VPAAEQRAAIAAGPIINEAVLQEEEAPETAAAAQPAVEVAPTTGTGEIFTDSLRGGGSGPRMVWMPAGTYAMGSPDSTADFSERPQHQVSLPRFAIGQFEVTIAEYARFAGATGRKLPKTGGLDRATHPVFFVTWDDALAYVKWLSSQTGKSYRLPSEAEWEYAARGGTTGNYWWGRDIEPGKAHCFACQTALDPRQPARIGSFEANPYGLYDTAGNVEEWVHDCFHGSYEGAPDDGSVFEGGDCRLRVVRGGGYSSGPRGLRSAARNKLHQDSANDGIGFRVARDE
jgi:formylglycine-generating enzyme required for sulfatase activity